MRTDKQEWKGKGKLWSPSSGSVSKPSHRLCLNPVSQRPLIPQGLRNVIGPLSPGPSDAFYYSPAFKNSRAVRQNDKLTIIKLMLVWKCIASAELLGRMMLPEGHWMLAAPLCWLASTFGAELGFSLKMQHPSSLGGMDRRH